MIRVFAAVSACLLAAAAAPAQTVETLWTNNCLQCHGPRGAGGPLGTSSLLNDEYLGGGSDRDLFRSIKEGHPAHGMPGFHEVLTDPQMWAMVVYIRELQARADGAQQRTNLERPFETQKVKYTASAVVSEGLSVPWSMAFLPASAESDAAMLITNRPGELVVSRQGEVKRVEGTPRSLHLGQGGLMEVRLHPNYAENRWVYLSYTDGIGEGRRSIAMTKVVRGRITESGGVWRWTDEETIFQAKEEHYLPGGVHFGCKIAFDPADPSIMFFTIGERGHAPLAQDLSRPNGKVHRVRDDGSIPDDNPFADRPEGEVYRSIWSYGHRNPQGLTFDLDGVLWSTEHGPRGGDELNRVEKGKNYGWPLVSYGINYQGTPLVTPWPDVAAVEKEIEMPVDTWTPSIAASGLSVVRGEMFGAWRGDLLAGGLASERIDRVRIRDGNVTERETVLRGLGRIRDIVEGPDGAIYIVLNSPDQVVRLEAE
jgi:aldose sugar dehydrogenase